MPTPVHPSTPPPPPTPNPDPIPAPARPPTSTPNPKTKETPTPSICPETSYGFNRLPRRFINRIITFFFVGSCLTCSNAERHPTLPPIQVVERVNLDRYLGTWYEIASFPQRFQRGCTATTATYSLRDNGTIDVNNQCRVDAFDGPLKQAKGRARIVDKQSNAKLKVSFFRPFWGDYWIIDLDNSLNEKLNYQFAVVGNPSRNYLWILSRKPTIEAMTYENILSRLREQHYDVSKLRRTKHAPPISEQRND